MRTMTTIESKPTPSIANRPSAYWETSSPAERTATRVFERAKVVRATVAR
ncbi:MAG: hypothetical protein ACO31E_09370 [Phycisphaerales bacterium]